MQMIIIKWFNNFLKLNNNYYKNNKITKKKFKKLNIIRIMNIKITKNILKNLNKNLKEIKG